jgi:hypothetical protein
MTNEEMFIGQIITVSPLGKRQFVIEAIDDMSDDMVYAAPVDGATPAQWFFTTYVKIMLEQEDAVE